MSDNLDQIIKRSLRKLVRDIRVRNWCAKEHEWVNYYAHHYLSEECSQLGPLNELGQICIEVSVPQPRGYEKKSVCRDLVIWSGCGQTAFGGVWEDRVWQACNHPL